MKLDYTIESPAERLALVNQILEENPNLNTAYLEYLADYLVTCMEKQERRQRKILTDNRLVTINKRETSFEGLAEKFENGEDGLYSFITEDKNVIFRPRHEITQKDLKEIKPLKEKRDSIEFWQSLLSKTTNGKDRYIIKHAISELQAEQYIIKDNFRGTVCLKQVERGTTPNVLPDSVAMSDNGTPIPSGCSLLDPKVCSAILCNYSDLIEDSWEDFDGDTKFMMMDFDRLCTEALSKYPIYEEIATYKIDGMRNQEIQKCLEKDHNIKYSTEYISNLWRQKIPLLIASKAEDEFLNWYYLNVAPGKYKRCSKCGEIKLAINKYFSKNGTSIDSFYSLCKECRNRKDKKV